MKFKITNVLLRCVVFIAAMILTGNVLIAQNKKAMPKGYWIVNSDIKDEAGHKAYIAANRAIFKQYGAKFLVRWGQKQIVEGTTSRSKQVIIEFKSYADALACYHSKEYQAAHKLRMGGVAETDMVIVEGFEGPLPNQ